MISPLRDISLLAAYSVYEERGRFKDNRPSKKKHTFFGQNLTFSLLEKNDKYIFLVFHESSWFLVYWY